MTADGRWSRRPRALVSDGGTGQGRSALAAVRLLDAGGWAPFVTTSGRWSLAASSRSCAGTRRSRGVADGVAAYGADLVALAAAEAWDAVVAASDAALVALDAPAARLLDKAVLAAAAEASGLRSPPTERLASWDELLDRADRLAYPVVVKPTRSTTPARAFDREADLRAAAEAMGELVVQPRIDEGLTAVAGVVHGGRLAAASHQRYVRTWPVPCGTASAAVTIEPDLDREERLVALLGDHDGVFQAQFAGPFLLDLNPRPYGSMALAGGAGVNLVALACDLGSGRRPVPGSTLRARPGVRYRWLEGDLRSVVADVRGGRQGPRSALRSLRPRPGTVHSVTMARDPRPLVARLGHALGSLR
jgi:predicted ATP-grasp superfamily ATP-dependent carboligase